MLDTRCAGGPLNLIAVEAWVSSLSCIRSISLHSCGPTGPCSLPDILPLSAVLGRECLGAFLTKRVLEESYSSTGVRDNYRSIPYRNSGRGMDHPLHGNSQASHRPECLSREGVCLPCFLSFGQGNEAYVGIRHVCWQSMVRAFSRI